MQRQIEWTIYHPPSTQSYLPLKSRTSATKSTTVALCSNTLTASNGKRPSSSRRDSGTRTADDLNSLLQSWCYFGLLCEVFGRPVKKEDFVRTSEENGRPVITTAALKDYLDEWIQRESALAADTRRADVERLAKCFSEMGRVFTEAFFEKVEFVRLAWRPAFVGDGSADEAPVLPMVDIAGANELLVSRMTADGWCPSEVRKLYMEVSSSELYFISRLERPGMNKSHRFCASDNCLAYQNVPETYKTQHVTDGCDCRFVFASQDSLFEILQQENAVSLVTTETLVDGNGKIHVSLASSTDTGFVAISHVWSDGLGNNSDNAIPRCQYMRICDLVAQASDGKTTAFWLDTLCFPLEPTEAYNLALIKMRESYKDAEIVLWTLQEGYIGASLYFQFSDYAVDPISAPRLTAEGYRWAPATLCDGQNSVAYYHLQDGYHTREDLAIRLPGVIISGIMRPLNRTFNMIDDSGCWFEISCLRNINGEVITEDVVEPSRYGILSTKQLPEQMAILLSEKLKRPDLADYGHHLDAVLVVIVGQDKGCIQCRYLYSVSVFKSEPERIKKELERIQEINDLGPTYFNTIVPESKTEKGESIYGRVKKLLKGQKEASDESTEDAESESTKDTESVSTEEFENEGIRDLEEQRRTLVKGKETSVK
ncbi:MAG: hypothetical protein LQ340_005327 [Diploschistes diacapsis]|nr:MAG: hypothetical protein LQ340_005327 [Diploschistes diacapsis]